MKREYRARLSASRRRRKTQSVWSRLADAERRGARSVSGAEINAFFNEERVPRASLRVSQTQSVRPRLADAEGRGYFGILGWLRL